jgi:hypothetical protein
MAEFKSQYPFVAFPSWILKKQIENPDWLSSKEILVLLALQSFADGMKEHQTVFPSIERLSSMTAICKRTVIDTIKSLQEKSLIEKTTRYQNGERKTNVYTLKIWNYDSPFAKQSYENVHGDTESQSADSAPTPDPKCKNRDPKCKNRPFISAGDAPKQEPLNKNQEQEPESPLTPLATGQAARAAKGKSKRSNEITLPPLPDYVEPYRNYLESWWQYRWSVHKRTATQVITKQTLGALQLAKELDVLEEFCEEASTKTWVSLGFAGHTDYIQKLARDKKFVPGKPVNYFQPRTTVDMEKHPSYRPLVIDDSPVKPVTSNDFEF